MNATKLTAGIVGLGRAGARRYRALAEADDIDVVWGVETAANGSSPAIPHFDSLAKACAVQVPDMAFICTPPGRHEALALDLLDRGVRHLLVEKPLACTGAAARRIQARADQLGATVKVGSNLRQFPEVKGLADLLASGRVGPIHDAVLNIGHDGGALQPWARDREMAGGGTLLDNGVHIVDLALWLGLMPTSGSVSGAVAWAAPGIDQRAEWTVAGPESTVSFTSSWQRNDGLYFSARLSGANGTVTVLAGRDDSSVSFDGDEGTFVTRFDGPADSWGDDTRSFLDGVRRGEAPGATGAQGARAIQLIETVYRAAAQGVSLNERL